MSLHSPVIYNQSCVPDGICSYKTMQRTNIDMGSVDQCRIKRCRFAFTGRFNHHFFLYFSFNFQTNAKDSIEDISSRVKQTHTAFLRTSQRECALCSACTQNIRCLLHSMQLGTPLRTLLLVNTLKKLTETFLGGKIILKNRQHSV